MTIPAITTARLELSPIRPSDTESIYHLYRDPEVLRYFDLLPLTTLSEAEQIVERWLRLSKEERQIRYGIRLQNDSSATLIGTIGIYSIYRHQNRTCIGFDLFPQYWGKGLMTEALSKFLDICHSEWDFQRIQALVLPGNDASAAVLNKCGFSHEGLLKSYEIWPGRGYVDLDMYAHFKGIPYAITHNKHHTTGGNAETTHHQ